MVKIPISAIISKEKISTHELECISSVVGKINKIDQRVLAQLLELNLPVRGYVNISLHKNSTDETKRRAISKILFSDRKRFEGANPLAVKRDNRNRITAYNPAVTEELLHSNALMLESNPEWYNDQKYIDFVFNIPRISITSQETVGYLIKKIKEALLLQMKGVDVELVKQYGFNYLIRDYYIFDNTSEESKIELLCNYIEVEHTKNQIVYVLKFQADILNLIIKTYWTTNDDLIFIINSIVNNNKNELKFPDFLGVPYYLGKSYFNNEPYVGSNFKKVIDKNILSHEIIFNLAKQDPYTLFYSLPIFNDRKDLIEIKLSIDHKRNYIEGKVQGINKLKVISPIQRNEIERANDVVEYYSKLVKQIDEKLDTK